VCSSRPSGGGLLWSVVLPDSVGCAGDDMADPLRSRLVLFEDGVELGPAHAPHAVVRVQGGGAYSHWGGSLLFSTSDGSDPNINGRRYAVAVGPAKPAVLAFGSCHIHDAVAGLAAQRLARPSWTRPVLTYSTSEALQLLHWSRGELTIPPHLLPFTSLPDDGPPGLPAAPDAVFLAGC
jgi:hypothetical protein